VTFFLEPEVELDAGGTYDSRDRALEGLFEAARRFAEGEIDVRSAYQVPRDAYLDRLEALTGREP
jgi:hypothetical protein